MKINKKVYTLSPIVLFVFNRPWHTKKTVEALKKNHFADKIILYIYSDDAKTGKDVENVKEVRNYIHSISGFKNIEIIERKTNFGLANSIISGVTEVINKHGKVIVLEDDLVTSPAFLQYMNYLLDKYTNEKNIFSITGYNHHPHLMKIPFGYPFDVYFNPRACSWSWGTWKDRWDKADWRVKDFDDFIKNREKQYLFNRGGEDMSRMLINQKKGKIDSWAIRWCYTLFKNNGICIYPIKSYINNIGHDLTGVHCDGDSKFNQSGLNKLEKPVLPLNIEVNEKLMDNFRKVYKKNILRKIVYNSIKNTFLYKSYLKIKYNKLIVKND